MFYKSITIHTNSDILKQKSKTLIITICANFNILKQKNKMLILLQVEEFMRDTIYSLLSSQHVETKFILHNDFTAVPMYYIVYCVCMCKYMENFS